MKLLSVILAGIVLVISVVLVVPVSAAAASPTAPIIAGRERALYLSFSGEGLSTGARAVVMARLQQDVQVLERVFLALHKAEKLNPRYTVLVVRARYQPEADRGVSSPAAVLSFAPATTLISGRTTSLGPAYVIDTTLLDFNDLLALLLLLPGLGEQSPVLTVQNSVSLTSVKDSSEFRAFKSMRLEFGPPSINWGSPDNKGLLPTWENGVFSYYVCDTAGNRLFALEPLDYYLARPSWSFGAPRLLAAATKTGLYFVELPARKTHRLDLTALFPQKYLQTAQSIILALSLQKEQIYFTLNRELPESFWQNEDHTYSFALDTGEIKVIDSIAPEAPSPAPVPPPSSGPGAIAEPTGPYPEGASLVHQLLRKLPAGWQLDQIGRHEGYVSDYWAEYLPQDGPFVFLPRPLFLQSRFVAYGSQQELVLFDLWEGKYQRLDLTELRPADYQKISSIRFAQNPSHLGDEIYFFLEGVNATGAAYVWNVVFSEVEQVDETLTQKQSLGWQELLAGAAHHVLPEGSRVITGREATGAIAMSYLSLVAGTVRSLSAWVLLLFFAFGLPLVLAHALPILLASKLNQAKLLFTYGPTLTATLFITLSLLAIRATVPHGELIRRLVYPLPWYYYLGSAAGMFIMAGFLTATIALLTMLVFHQARLLSQAFFPGAGNMQQDRRAIVISASAISGLAIAVLILLLFLAAAVTLPYYQLPRGWDVVLALALFYGLSLAVAYFLLRITPAAAGYLAAATAFLAVGYVVRDKVVIFRIIADYEQSFMGALRQLFTLERWLGYGAIVLPLAMVCLVYIVRRAMMRRGWTPKTLEALALAALIAVPATAVIVYAEQLPFLVPRMGIFAIPVTLVLFTVTAVVIFAALALVFAYPIALPATKTTLTVPASVVKEFHLLFGPKGAVVAGLIVFLQLAIARTAGGFLSVPFHWLLLVVQLYLAVAVVFYLGRFLTVRLAGALFTPERVNKLTSRS